MSGSHIHYATEQPGREKTPLKAPHIPEGVSRCWRKQRKRPEGTSPTRGGSRCWRKQRKDPTEGTSPTRGGQPLLEEAPTRPSRLSHTQSQAAPKANLFYSVLVYSILGCVLPQHKVSFLCQIPPTFSVLCYPCPCRSLLPHSAISPTRL